MNFVHSATLVKSKIRSSFLFYTKVTIIKLNRVYKLNRIDRIGITLLLLYFG